MPGGAHHRGGGARERRVERRPRGRIAGRRGGMTSPRWTMMDFLSHVSHVETAVAVEPRRRVDNLRRASRRSRRPPPTTPSGSTYMSRIKVTPKIAGDTTGLLGNASFAHLSMYTTAYRPRGRSLAPNWPG